MTYNEGWLNKNYYNPLVKNNKFEYEFQRNNDKETPKSYSRKEFRNSDECCNLI